MAIALGRENMGNQNKLAEADAFQQLVRLLRTRKADDSVLLTVIKVLGILCIGRLADIRSADLSALSTVGTACVHVGFIH